MGVISRGTHMKFGTALPVIALQRGTLTTRLMRASIPAALAFALCLSASPKAVEAATPSDTLVIAMSIDDIISLDPAEIFEITTSEMLTSTYERLVTTDTKDPTKIIPQIAESWSFSDDGKSITFKMKVLH